MTLTDTKKGLVVGNFFIRGLSTQIVVDDNLYFNWKNSLKFAGLGKDRSTYGAFIEKLYAKAMGNYESIVGGNSGEAHAFLTGAPSDSIDYQTKEFTGQEVWSKVSVASDRKFVIEASTGSNPNGDKAANEYGIAYGHSYSLISTCVLTDKSGTVLDRVMQIRNPWGTDSWNDQASTTYSGKWNDQDPAWDNVAVEVKEKCGFVNNVNDGIFFVSET